MLKVCLPLFAVAAALGARDVRADHGCDALGEEGWSTLATHETVNVADGAPYQAGNGWFVDRSTTVLPLCNYINAAGNYSLRSYSLSPEERKERITICHAGPAGASVAVPPYTGPCPPK